MPLFSPLFTITSSIIRFLADCESAKREISQFPLTPRMLLQLHQSARVHASHYSTFIEGNRLTCEQVESLLYKQTSFVGRTRDEKEVLGYYQALDFCENAAQTQKKLDHALVQKIHALVMGGGKKRVALSSYRDGQNVIRDGATHAIVYLPPEASDVTPLMGELFEWIEREKDIPVIIRAGILHYQIATIHPYYDGNGRTARLLTTFLMHREGYDLHGIYSLEAYYAENLHLYYDKLSIGPSHNYYMGRAEADITSWIEYFCAGVADAFKRVSVHAAHTAGVQSGQSENLMRHLDPKQRKVLTHFTLYAEITANDVARILGIQQRTARNVCKKWLDGGFLDVINASKKGRRYKLGALYQVLITHEAPYKI